MPKKAVEAKKEKKVKELTGTIVSLKMQGTAIVEVERKTMHPLYKKVLTRSKKYKVDTNSQELSVGDRVLIVETRPISKNKFFRVEKNGRLKGGVRLQAKRTGVENGSA